MRKPAFCICENKDADQLRSNCAADHRLCFRYLDSTTPLLPKSEIPSLYPSSVAVQPGLCRTRSETPKTGFPTTRRNYLIIGTCPLTATFYFMIYFFGSITFHFIPGGAVAWWLTPRTPDPEVGGSSPTRVAVLCS